MFTLLRVQSDRVDANGKPYEDIVLACRNEKGVIRYCRVKAWFRHDYWILEQNAVRVPSGEPMEKYVG